MPFPIISILTAIPSIFSAYKTVKTINDDNSHKAIKKHQKDNKQPVLKTYKINALGKDKLNSLKRQVVVDILAVTLLSKIKKRGGNKDDLGVIVDFACLIYKLVKGKK